jgi:two-component system CheB/CheR fusion protein
MRCGEPERNETSDAQDADGKRLLIVGIGASEGGLESFERFLQRVRPDGGLAYVLVQHLSPEHERLLAELPARAAHVPVEIANDG